MRSLGIFALQGGEVQGNVFVPLGERVNKDLWYTAPVSRHTVSSQFSDRRDEMGLPWDAVLHSTRHTALTDLGAAGADAFTIQAVAGHASVTTSQRYVHPVPETMMLAMTRLDAYRRARQQGPLVHRAGLTTHGVKPVQR